MFVLLSNVPQNTKSKENEFSSEENFDPVICNVPLVWPKMTPSLLLTREDDLVSVNSEPWLAKVVEVPVRF